MILAFCSMETFALFLLLLVLSPWKTSCQLDTVAFIRPPPLGADTPEELYQLGFMVTFQWTSATDDPIGLGVWQPNTADDEGDIIFLDKSGLSSWNWTVETSRSISSAFKLQIFSGSNTSDTVAQSQHFQITDSATTTTSTSLSPSATTLDGTAGGAGNTNTVSGSGGGLSPGDKAGIGIGVASLIATVIGVVIAWKQYKKKSIE